MKYSVLIIRVNKGKISNGNNILGQDIKDKIRWIQEEISGFQAWENFEKNEL